MQVLILLQVFSPSLVTHLNYRTDGLEENRVSECARKRRQRGTLWEKSHLRHEGRRRTTKERREKNTPSKHAATPQYGKKAASTSINLSWRAKACRLKLQEGPEEGARPDKQPGKRCRLEIKDNGRNSNSGLNNPNRKKTEAKNANRCGPNGLHQSFYWVYWEADC